MATGLTSNYSIPYPLSTDPVNVAGDIQQLAEKFDLNLTEWTQDTSAGMWTSGGTFSNGLQAPTYNDSTGKMSMTLAQDIQTTASPTFNNITLSGDILPDTDNTGVVGNASFTWNNGQFTNLTIDGILSVRTAIDLADSDILRFGSSDDTQMFYNGSTNIMNIELETSAVSLNITDNGTNKVIITKSTGNISTVGQFISTVASGTSPLSVSSNTLVANLNSDLLDGQQGSYYLDWTNVTNKPDPTITLGGDASGSLTLTDLAGGTLTVTVIDDSHNHIIGNVDGLQAALDAKANLASPTFTGTVTVATLDLTTADTATAASHYWVATGGDGVVRPKTLANVKTEIVTTAAVNTAAATTVGTITSGTWAATDIGLAHGGTNASLTAVAGGVIYSTSTAMAITSAGTAGQVLTSNGTSAPTWQDAAAGGGGSADVATVLMFAGM